MTDISNARVAILATDGFEKSELFEPKAKLEEWGADVTVVSQETAAIKSWDETDWGESVDVDMTIENAEVEAFDALVLPGGLFNPDSLRKDQQAVGFVRDFYNTGRPLAAICHAPWLLAEAGVASGRRLTSYDSIITDMKNAGAYWEDEEVIVDGNLITSRNPGDLPVFCATIAQEIKRSRPAPA